MANYVTKIRTQSGEKQIDYTALANLPQSDTTLTQSGSFADAKVTGDKIAEVSNNVTELSNSFSQTTTELSQSITEVSENVTELFNNFSQTTTELSQDITEVSDSVTELSTNMTQISKEITELSDGMTELKPEDIGALPNTYTPPVVSVNGKTGQVVLSADDVGAVSNAAVVAVAKGGTGATNAAAALANLGIIYSSTQPSSAVTGQIWLKPAT